MPLPKLYWSSILFVPALAALVVVEPVVSLVAATGLLALWAGLRGH